MDPPVKVDNLDFTKVKVDEPQASKSARTMTIREHERLLLPQLRLTSIERQLAAKKNRKAIQKENQRQYNEMVAAIEKRDKAKEKKRIESANALEYENYLKKEKADKSKKEY